MLLGLIFQILLPSLFSRTFVQKTLTVLYKLIFETTYTKSISTIIVVGRDHIRSIYVEKSGTRHVGRRGPIESVDSGR